MKKHIKEILIIIIVISSIVFGSYGFFYHKYIKPNLYTVAFQDIDGVIVGSPVHFLGVVIGHVRHLKIKDNMVIVEIIVTKKNVKIPKNSVIKVEFSGMGGSKSMEIQPSPDASDGITSLKPIRISDIFRFNKMYAMSMIAFEKDLRNVKDEDIMGGIEKIPAGYNFGQADKTINDAGIKLNKLNDKFMSMENFEQKVNSVSGYFTDFFKKIPYGKGDKSK